MKKHCGQIVLSASDLVGHLNCGHLTELDLQVAEGSLAKPKRWDPLLEVLRERGDKHEKAFIEHLEAQGLSAVCIDGVDITPAAVTETRAAMEAGSELIVQAALEDGRWVGRADILRRVEKPSNVGPWSYEIIDTKLARETKAGSVLQLCLYADLLEKMQGIGLCLLAEPSDGDIFFDIESDAFVGEHGIEYLFGYVYRDKDGDWTYTADWAFDREGEKAIFERFVDFVNARREKYPDLHIYHYAPYEPAALKRLMGRYATRENEIDDFLRSDLLVDLYSVVRNGLRAGVESYSIKKLEPIYSFVRDTSLPDANVALARLQAGLELGDIDAIDSEVRATVQSYNYEDCTSTIALRDWFEDRRQELVDAGTDVPRPLPSDEEPSEALTERQEAVQVLIERLTADVPADIEERTVEQHAKWILANILDWHRREDKAAWWEYFRLSALTPEELIDERAALSQLSVVGDVSPLGARTPVHRYAFPQQDTDLRGDEKLRMNGGEKFGSVVAVSADDRTIDIKKMGKMAMIHPDAVFAHQMFNMKEQADALMRLGEYVADHGIEGEGPYQSARALLLRLKPEIGDGPIRQPGKTTLQAALRVVREFGDGIFPIQGPPGTGKSYTGARMICELVKREKKVGITANSHKVIRNLLDKVVEAAPEMNANLCCVQKPKSGDNEPDQDCLKFVTDNAGVYAALDSGAAQVAGATHFLWSRADALDVLDVLVIDEAAQMSLANVLAVAQSAKTLILLGDPQQLDQPMQGTHPDGTGVSALEHVLDGGHTIAADQGLFLEETWRLHPEICQFNSELFYDEKLHSVDGCELQEVCDGGPLTGTGLRFLPVDHFGNKSSSIEEADAVANLVEEVLSGQPTWIDREGQEQPLTLEDILIIAPYNAQVFEIQQRLPDARVGTVDKFQGQEAPIAIYSMATSSHADAPRGMEFLYSANRFNVAISRAKCVAVLVASPMVFEAECRTPRQMQLANAFCRYLELVVQKKPQNSTSG